MNRTRTVADGKASETELKNDEKDDTIDKTLFPDELAGVKRGEPMTFDDADHEKPNPNFNQGGGYEENCQTCVVAYEARLRGYDVQALPNTTGSKLEELSYQTNKAWIDSATGKYPAYIVDDTVTNAKQCRQWLENTIEADKRYTLEFDLKERRRVGHIISVDRLKDGTLRFYDPQNSVQYTGKDIDDYLKKLKYTTTFRRRKISGLTKVLRVDDKQFNSDIVNHILKRG